MSELTPDDLREFMKRLEQWDRFTGGGFADAWQSQLAERDGLIERLKQEAQGHAMEARAHRSTVHECYQAVGAQKGNWNGATPIVDAVAGYKKRIAELNKNAEILYIAANRYHLGRASFAVAEWCELLIMNWLSLPERAQIVIKRDIKAELDRDNEARKSGSDWKPLGMDCDRAQWDKVWHLINDESEAQERGEYE